MNMEAETFFCLSMKLNLADFRTIAIFMILDECIVNDYNPFSSLLALKAHVVTSIESHNCLILPRMWFDAKYSSHSSRKIRCFTIVRICAECATSCRSWHIPIICDNGGVLDGRGYFLTTSVIDRLKTSVVIILSSQLSLTVEYYFVTAFQLHVERKCGRNDLMRSNAITRAEVFCTVFSEVSFCKKRRGNVVDCIV